MLNAQSAERKFGEEMTLHLLPILHSINMNASADGSDMLLFERTLLEVGRMNDLERKEEELFVEAMINLWIRNDAPQWIVDYVRKELRKQRGLSDD